MSEIIYLHDRYHLREKDVLYIHGTKEELESNGFSFSSFLWLYRNHDRCLDDSVYSEHSIHVLDWIKLENKKDREYGCRKGLKENYKKRHVQIYRTSSNQKDREMLRKEKELNSKPKEKRVVSLNSALIALNACFTINKNVKKNAYSDEIMSCCNDDCCDRCYGCGEYIHTTVDYDLRDNEYKRKTLILRSVIHAIRENRLPIKYGKLEGILYFQYLWNQVSFHDPKDQVNAKEFNWIWNGIKNKKIPFITTK